MRYNARKKVSVYTLSTTYGDYGEVVKEKKLFSSGTELVCPMKANVVKRDYGYITNNPKKIIYSKALPIEDELLIEVDGRQFSLLERTDFDKFNILLVDEVKN